MKKKKMSDLKKDTKGMDVYQTAGMMFPNNSMPYTNRSNKFGSNEEDRLLNKSNRTQEESTRLRELQNMRLNKVETDKFGSNEEDRLLNKSNRTQEESTRLRELQNMRLNKVETDKFGSNVITPSATPTNTASKRETFFDKYSNKTYYTDNGDVVKTSVPRPTITRQPKTLREALAPVATGPSLTIDEYREVENLRKAGNPSLTFQQYIDNKKAIKPAVIIPEEGLIPAEDAPVTISQANTDRVAYEKSEAERKEKARIEYEELQKQKMSDAMNNPNAAMDAIKVESVEVAKPRRTLRDLFRRK